MSASSAVARDDAGLFEFDHSVFDDHMATSGAWGTLASGSAGLVLVAPRDRAGAVQVSVVASLGALSASWDMTVDFEASTTAVVEVPFGRESYLDPVAERYLTPVDVVVHDGVRTWGLPRLYLVWSSGVDAPPEVWDRATVAERAPHGVLDAELEASLQARLPGRSFWVAPPTAELGTPPPPERDGPAELDDEEET